MTTSETESWPLTPGQYGNAFRWVWLPDEPFWASIRGVTYIETQTPPAWKWLGPTPREETP